MFAETGAIERAGRRVETRALLQLFGGLVLSRDNAYEAVRARGLAARVGEPSAAILNPCRRIAPIWPLRRERVTGVVGNAATLIDTLGSNDRVVARFVFEAPSRVP
jgi:hypothetical protein